MPMRDKCIWEYVDNWKDFTVEDIDHLVQAGADVNKGWSSYEGIPFDYRNGSHIKRQHTPLLYHYSYYLLMLTLM